MTLIPKLTLTPTEHLQSAATVALGWRRFFGPRSLTPALIILFACTTFGCGTNGSATLRSVATPVNLTAKLTTLAYTSSDVNTADVYMTDLPKSALEPEADLSGVSGVLVHLHMFITPLAGETPIANSACSATVRSVVIADGHVGVYGGGGFLAPKEPPGGQTFGGEMRDASCRLSTKSPGFADRLGSAVFSSSFRVPKDPQKGKLIERRLSTILASLPPPKPIENPNAKPAMKAEVKGEGKPESKPAEKSAEKPKP